MKHRCMKHSRRLCVRCLVFTAGFPVEHLLWEKAPLLRSITAVMGL